MRAPGFTRKPKATLRYPTQDALILELAQLDTSAASSEAHKLILSLAGQELTGVNLTSVLRRCRGLYLDYLLATGMNPRAATRATNEIVYQWTDLITDNFAMSQFALGNLGLLY